MSRILPVGGAFLLTVAALLPFRASASETPSRAQPLALAISQPIAGVVAWRGSSPTVYEPGLLLFVGGGLLGIGSWLRRATPPRERTPPDT